MNDMTITVTDRKLKALADGVDLSQITHARLEELQTLCYAKKAAAESFTEAVKAVAEKANIEPSALSVYVTFLCKDIDKQQKARKAHEQLELLFDEMGADRV